MPLHFSHHGEIRLRRIVQHHGAATAHGELFAVGRQRQRHDGLIGRRQRDKFHRCDCGFLIRQRCGIPDDTALDPVADGFDLRVRELLLRRHVRIGLAQQRLGHPADIGLARHDDRSVVVALEQRLPRREHQPALFLLLVVTAETLCFERGQCRAGGPASARGSAFSANRTRRAPARGEPNGDAEEQEQNLATTVHGGLL